MDEDEVEDMAERLGIGLHARTDVPWDVGSDGDVVIYGWHPDARVRVSRQWEGIAQCLLTRRGVAWSPDQASALAARLRTSARYH